MSETRVYEIRASGGTYRMTIPDDWKVTYGPVSPGGKTGYGSENALRVYESDTKQRAIFVGVASFRDLSIPVQRLLIKRQGSETWESDEGGSSRTSKTVIDRKWVDANADSDADEGNGSDVPF